MDAFATQTASLAADNTKSAMLERQKQLAAQAKTREDIKAAAQDFEAMFISQMLQPMFSETMDGGPFGGGSAEATFKGLMIEEYGKSIAASGQIGIAPVLEAEMLRMQGLEQLEDDKKPQVEPVEGDQNDE